ncbi:hypothetical protein [Catenulispora rubra]|uniref:hypothetical protein n=1 Tax=Catenulispora rubra TaxID=280293 RepID=UPI001891FB19|nr:hypothetical protein [Catenulispora rubra]
MTAASADSLPARKTQRLELVSEFKPLTCDVTVEVLRRYSNRPDLYGPLSDVVKRIDANDQGDEPGVQSTGTGTGLTPVRQRVDVDLSKIVESFRSGVVIHELAAQFGVGPTTVKRILREAGARRMDVNQDEIVESFLSGVIIRELAEHHGISVATVKRVLRKHGVGKKNRR